MEKLYAFTVTDKVLEELKRFMKGVILLGICLINLRLWTLLSENIAINEVQWYIFV